MNRRPVVAASLAAALLLPGLALASPAPAAADASAPVVASDLAAAPAEFAANALAIGASFLPGPPEREPRWRDGDAGVSAVRYRPRGREDRWSRGPWLASPVQVHLGFFNPNGDGGNSFVAGFRGGPLVDPHVQIGLGVDWMHKSEHDASIISSSPGPGGTTITTQQQLSESSSDLVPVMAFVQVIGDDKMQVIPFAGLAGGYEVLQLSATDYRTGASFDGTFGGWGWQLWGGAALPLSGQARVVGEVFVNTCEVSRDSDGPDGITYHETVKQDGVGARLGLSWGF